ncbi:response regulator [Bdellovibrio sp. SKB1291214]|uniref:response regulator transcription factor n=1 Tax=Bdellovibrio sp. SKB1291214 TaxID=1732569 RepID=UPI000B51DD8A|nr:response regulator [Bdellovibrio sp. SKB1291214]UYL08769.1 response regulator [Bdellovibrio sp. SKB1291214]
MKKRVKNILMIEDDTRLREVLHQELEERDFAVQSFAELPDLERVHPPDGILLDLRVGNDNGLDFINLLNAKFPGVRIVMMSGFGSVASAVKSMQLGAENFLAKPVTPDMIVRAFAEEDAAAAATVPKDEAEISLARMEREYIDYVLNTSNGNITQAAKKLGLHRQSLQRKLRKNIPNK